MSSEATNPDTQLLEVIKSGYNAEIIDPLLIVRDIPSLTGDGRVSYGTLCCTLHKPDGVYAALDHTFYFRGEKPFAAPGKSYNMFASETATFEIPTVGVAQFYPLALR